jgi:type VI secretion system secreted protein Hcp
MAKTCKRWLGATICLLFLVAPVSAPAGWVGFLRLDGVTGESTDTNHPGWLPVQSADIAKLSVTISDSGTNRITGKPSIGQLCFQRSMDKASPALMLDLAGGHNFNTGTLDLTMTNFSQMEFFRLNLTNIFLGSISQAGGAGGDSRPQEEICLSPQQILSWSYVQTSQRSGLPLGYNSTAFDLSTLTGTASTNFPVFMSTGINVFGNVQLSWNATAGKSYRIYSVPDLSQLFVPLVQMTATSSGPTNYTVMSQGSAMFFVVGQIPNGY